MMTNTHIEEYVMGAMIIGRLTVSQVLSLGVSCFDYVPHQTIYQTIMDLHADLSYVDRSILIERLERDKLLEGVGGEAYIAHLVCKAPSTGVEHFVDALIDKRLRGQLRDFATQLINQVDANNQSAIQTANLAEEQLFQLSMQTRSDGFIPLEVSLSDTLERIERVYESPDIALGITTGFPSIDERFLGFQRETLSLIAGPSGVGKTAFAASVASHAALERGDSIAVFSLDLSRDQMTRRLLAAKAEVDLFKLCTGKLHDEEWERLAIAGRKMGEAPIYICDTSDITIIEMYLQIFRLKREYGLSMVIVDYLQLVKVGRDSDLCEKKAILEVVRGLKKMARTLGVAVLGLVQWCNDTGRRPQTSDFSNSGYGALDREADVVMFLDYLEINAGAEASSEVDRPIELTIGKQRNGPIGSVRM